MRTDGGSMSSLLERPDEAAQRCRVEPEWDANAHAVLVDDQLKWLCLRRRRFRRRLLDGRRGDNLYEGRLGGCRRKLALPSAFRLEVPLPVRQPPRADPGLGLVLRRRQPAVDPPLDALRPNLPRLSLRHTPSNTERRACRQPRDSRNGYRMRTLSLSS